MKSKLVLWGRDPRGSRVLLALSLLEKENKIESLVFEEEVVTTELENEILKKWVEEDIQIPDVYTRQLIVNDLSLLDSILPQGYTTDKDDIIKRAQTEWHFIVLSTRLFDVYNTELNSIKDKIEELHTYEQAVWDDLKEFWDKIQVQIYEKNLLRSHAQHLKETTNKLFNSLKELRKSLDKERQEQSKVLYEGFLKKLEDIEQRIEKGLSLQPIFEDLRQLQGVVNKAELLKDHRKKLWNRLDASFKKVKELRFGDSTQEEKNQIIRIESRINGLDGAIMRMQHVIKLDQKELDRLQKPSEGPFGILEEQLKGAKRKMIEERLQSKQLKLDDMLKTREELLAKIQEIKAKDEKRKLIEEARKLAEQKIAEEIKAAEESRKEEEEKLLKAASELKENTNVQKRRTKANPQGDLEAQENLEANLLVQEQSKVDSDGDSYTSNEGAEKEEE